MNHSPYQHQDPRQLDLEQQMEKALQQQDRQLLSRLELQWVHRFGVDSLPSGFIAAEEPAAPSLADQQPSFVAIAPEKSDVDSEPEQVTAESSEPELVNPGLNRFTSLLRNCLDVWVVSLILRSIPRSLPAPLSRLFALSQPLALSGCVAG